MQKEEKEKNSSFPFSELLKLGQKSPEQIWKNIVTVKLSEGYWHAMFERVYLSSLKEKGNLNDMPHNTSTSQMLLLTNLCMPFQAIHNE